MKTILPVLAVLVAGVVGACYRPAMDPTLATRNASLPRIGYLADRASTPAVRQSFLDGLNELGHVPGRNVAVDFWIEGDDEQSPGAAAAAMVASGADVIVAESPQMVRTAMAVTQTIPIVMTRTPYAVESGLVQSRARPGGNVTGVSRPSYAAKQIELLKEAVPHAARIAVPVLSTAFLVEWAGLQDAATQLGVELVRIDNPQLDGTDLDPVLQQAVERGADALLPFGGPPFDPQNRYLGHLATQYGLPSIYGRPGFAEGGGLLAFGGEATDQTRRAAVFVDRLLRGAKASELPLEEPTSYFLIVNLNTANQLGLTVPPSLTGRATRLIVGPSANPGTLFSE